MYISKKKFSKIKKIDTHLLSSDVLRLIRWIFELKHSRFHSFFVREHAKLHRMPFFFILMCFAIIQRHSCQRTVGKGHF